MKRFEVGRVYRANDSVYDPLRIVKRTARTVVVENVVHQTGTWRMLLHEDYDRGTEYIVDSTNVGTRWEHGLTYRADLEVAWDMGTA